jgi:hypothetical protein
MQCASSEVEGKWTTAIPARGLMIRSLSCLSELVSLSGFVPEFVPEFVPRRWAGGDVLTGFVCVGGEGAAG